MCSDAHDLSCIRVCSMRGVKAEGVEWIWDYWSPMLISGVFWYSYWLMFGKGQAGSSEYEP